MAEEKKQDKPEWGGFKGTIVKGSLVEADGKITATGKTAEGKEHRVVAYPHMKNGADALRAAHESGAEVIVRGPMLGSAQKGTFHFGAATVTDPAAPKAEKADKAPKGEKAPKAELTEEEKAAKAEAARAAALARDASRFPVKVGAAKEGDTLVVNGADVTVTKLGREFELDEKGVADLAARFDGVEFAVGDKVAYASFEAPEAEKEVENAGPSA